MKMLAWDGRRFEQKRLPFIPRLLPLRLLAMSLALCMACGFSCAASAQATTQLLAPDAIPLFNDDLHYQGLERSLQESLAYLGKLPPERHFAVAGQTVSVARLKQTIHTFLGLVEKRPDTGTLNQALREQFLVYRIRPSSTVVNSNTSSPSTPLLLTGYFQPVFQGSLNKKAPYLYPLYTIPKTLVQHNTAKGFTVSRRDPQGQLVPFWTRREIEQGNLLAGTELVWLKDPFDAFLIHVQGSALVFCVGDQSTRAVSYAAKNGRPYTSIGTYLVKNNKMRVEEVSMDSLRRYLEAHPQEREHILQQNDSYIFFSWSTVGPVHGSLYRPLTPGRSVAADQKLYPPGLLMFVHSTIPKMEQNRVTDRMSLQRFVSVQDSGSAIQGPYRLDLFCGTGDDAGRLAGEMKERGELFVILAKEP